MNLIQICFLQIPRDLVAKKLNLVTLLYLCGETEVLAVGAVFAELVHISLFDAAMDNLIIWTGCVV